MKPQRFRIIVLTLVGVLIAVQGLLGNIVATQFQERLGSWAHYVLPTFLIITGILIGYTVRDQLAGARERQDVQRDDHQAQQNRRAMLRKVRTVWIDGLLKHSLSHETRIALGLHERPDAVVRPLDVLVHLPQQAERPLPPDKRIIEVFDTCDGTLLILGAPGAGKTMLLLELARDLLDHAEHNPTHPIPVVFPLSSWAERRLPLDEWLVDELNKRYDVPRKLAQAWVADDHILPLLDGLDEVAPEHRSACVEAINTYRREHGLLPLVVSSRIADYDALAVKLRLHGAIVVQPLTREQVKVYLQEIGLRVAPSSTSPLWEVLDTPLMLNIATLTYAGQDAQPLPVGPPEVQRDQIFAAYVASMFKRRPTSQQFTQEHTLKWLSWLAWQMQQHQQTVLYLEHLQPEWLPTGSARWQYALLDRVGGGLVVGLSYGLGVGLVVGPVVGLGDGLGVALLTTLFGPVLLQRSPMQQGVVQRIKSTLIGGLVVGLASGLLGGLAVGLVFGLFGALAGALVGSPHIRPRRITAVESLRWSGQQAWRSMLTGLGVGLVFGLMVGLLGGLVDGLVNGLILGLIGGLVFGLMVGLIFGLVGGVTSSSVEQKVGPNQGIRRSGRNALVVGLVGGLAIGLAIGLVGGLAIGLDFGLIFGLVFGLANGGYACLSHTALRLVLWQKGTMPLSYVRFLDENAQRILLRKVGGGYIFIHRLLLEHFAKQYRGPETTE